MQNYTRKILLSNDEFFILIGIVALNMKNSENIITSFKSYTKTSKVHKITLSEEIIDEILEVCDKHTGYDEDNLTFKTIVKLRKTKELIELDKEYEKNISKICVKWGGEFNN